MNSWEAAVQWDGTEPASVELTVEVQSLQVLRGEGALMPLSGPEKTLARSHALKCLDAERFPLIRFRADDVAKNGDGYRLAGTLDIHGEARERVVDVQVADLGETWRLSCDAVVRQSDFGVKPKSMLMGSVKVVDDVTVSFSALHAK